MDKNDLIAGKIPPKWQVNDQDALEVVLDNMAKNDNNVLRQNEAANQERERLGICKKCRMVNCLCKEGQF